MSSPVGPKVPNLMVQSFSSWSSLSSLSLPVGDLLKSNLEKDNIWLAEGKENQGRKMFEEGQYLVSGGDEELRRDRH